MWEYVYEMSRSGTTESEEDFDWESDDEETTDKADTPHARAASLAESTKTLVVAKSDTLLPTSGTNSRVSSEDGSYDIVSSQVSSNAGDSKHEQHAESDGESDESDEESDSDDDEEDHKTTEQPVNNTKAVKRSDKASAEDEDDSDWE